MQDLYKRPLYSMGRTPLMLFLTGGYYCFFSLPQKSPLGEKTDRRQGGSAGGAPTAPEPRAERSQGPAFPAPKIQ
jgi:hypothetical protein